jgi:hypothetical protein
MRIAAFELRSQECQHRTFHAEAGAATIEIDRLASSRGPFEVEQ